MQRFRLVILLLVAALLVASCGSGSGNGEEEFPTPSLEEPTPISTDPTLTPRPKPTQRPTQKPEQLFKIATLSSLDALPLFIAQTEGLFKAHDLDVRITFASTAEERDMLVRTQEVDGVVTELFSTLYYNRHSVELKVVRTAFVASQGSPHYYLLASKQSGITTIAGLKNVGVGMPASSLEAYIASHMLADAGLTPGEMISIDVPSAGDRLTLVTSGQMAAVMLPDPLASVAIQRGAVVLADDSAYPALGPGLYAFHRLAVEEKPDAIRAFLAAIDEAVALINSNPEKYRALLTTKNLIPAEVADTFKLPVYPTVASIPSQDDWVSLLTWAKSKDIVLVDVPFGVSVVQDFLP